MKSHDYRHSDTHRPAGFPRENRSTRERGMHAVNPRPPPSFPHRRYPSLSDDGQPYFLRPRRTRRDGDKDANATNPATESARSLFLPVRTIALLAIILIIVALVAST